MKRLAAFLALAFAALTANAQQPVLRIQFIYNADASFYWGGAANVANAINAVAADMNTSFAASQINGSVAVAGITAGDARPISASGVWSQLLPTTYNHTIADAARVNNADIIVVVTQHQWPNSAVGSNWTGDKGTDALNNTIVIDASVLSDQRSLLYWIGRQMGTKNQRAGGIGNETTGTAHGWWIKFGNSVGNCETAETIDADDSIIQDYGGTCVGWDEPWKSPQGVIAAPGQSFTPSYHECDAQAYCTSDAQDWVRTLPNSTWAAAPSMYTNWRGIVAGAAPNGLTCSARADRNVLAGGGIIDTGAQTMGAPVTKPYAFICPKPLTHINVFSNPNISYRGVPLGDPNSNSVATINANIAVKAQTHTYDRAQLIAGLLKRKR